MNPYFKNIMTEEELKMMTRLSTVSELEDFCLKNYSDLPAINLSSRTLTYKEMWS